jgi:hypothetical protein
MVYTKTDFVDGDYVNAKTLSDDDGYNTLNNNANIGTGLLGEIRQFDISRTNAVSKATLQGYGWAICDGTTPASQGISSPTITTTPDLREKFLRHSANETTGGTGGSETHNHQWYKYISNANHTGIYQGLTANAYTYDSDGNERDFDSDDARTLTEDYWTSKVTALPPYYDICYFIKVK